MSNTFSGIITQKDILFDKDMALKCKLLIDKQHEEKVHAKKAKLKFVCIIIAIFEIVLVVVTSILAAKQWYAALEGSVFFSALAVAIMVFFIKRIEKFNFGYPEYPKPVEFHILTDGLRIEPSSFEQFGSQAHIRLILVNDKDEITVKHFYCAYVYKKGISRATLDLSNELGILYVPYFPVGTRSASSDT